MIGEDLPWAEKSGEIIDERAGGDGNLRHAEIITSRSRALQFARVAPERSNSVY